MSAEDPVRLRQLTEENFGVPEPQMKVNGEPREVLEEWQSKIAGAV